MMLGMVVSFILNNLSMVTYFVFCLFKKGICVMNNNLRRNSQILEPEIFSFPKHIEILLLARNLGCT